MYGELCRIYKFESLLNIRSKHLWSQKFVQRYTGDTCGRVYESLYRVIEKDGRDLKPL